jgi:hypothetical protein
LPPSGADPFFYLGDEFYLMCGRPVAGYGDHYGGFPQIEDGIGITATSSIGSTPTCGGSRPGSLEDAREPSPAAS